MSASVAAGDSAAVALCGRDDAEFQSQLEALPPNDVLGGRPSSASSQERDGDHQKGEWARRMRLLFSPLEMLHAGETLPDDALKLPVSSVTSAAAAAGDEDAGDSQSGGKSELLDGQLNADYFVGSARFVDPATGALVEMGGSGDSSFGGSLQFYADSTKWTPGEHTALISALESFGVGDWDTIQQKADGGALSDFAPAEIRWKCAHLLGRFDLSEYVALKWRPDADAIQNERRLNEEVGRKYDQWKSGLLVADADGNVERDIAERRLEKPLRSSAAPETTNSALES